MSKMEHGIPMPTPARNKYRFGDMEVGDSFKLDANMGPVLVRMASIQYGTRTGTKFSTVKYEGGYRCWRIK